MSTFRYPRLARPLAAAAACSALMSSASFGQEASEAEQGPPLYRVEVIVFRYEEGDPAEELYGHTATKAAAARAAARDDRLASFDFGPYLPLEATPFGDGGGTGRQGGVGTSEEDAGRSDRPRRLLGPEDEAGDIGDAGPEADRRADEPADGAGEPTARGETEGLEAAAGNAAGTEGMTPGTEGGGTVTAPADPSGAGDAPPGAEGAQGFELAESGENAEPADPLGPGRRNAAAPFRFRLLSDDELNLVDARRRLERLDAYTPLVHGGWVQEGLPLSDAQPFDLAYLGATNPAGTVRLHLSRYLHVAVDLLHRTEAGPRARRAVGRDRLGFGEDRSSFGEDRSGLGEDSSGLGENRSDVAEDRSGYRENRSGFGEGLQPYLAQPLSEVALPPRYVLRAERRISSGTVQYFDHPMFGVLVLVEPYEPPAADDPDSVGPAA